MTELAPLPSKLPPGVADVGLFPTPEHSLDNIFDIVRENLCDADYHLIPALLATVDPNEESELVEVLMDISIREGKLNRCLDYLLTEELSRTEDVSTLFRESSAPSICLTELLRNLGSKFLKDRLASAMDAVRSSGTEAELLAALNTLIDCIVASAADMPDELCYFFARVYRAVKKRFGSAYVARDGVAAFLFLRYFSLALSWPSKFGMREVSLEQTRYAIAISRVLSGLVMRKKWTAYDPPESVKLAEQVEHRVDELDAFIQRVCKWDLEQYRPREPEYVKQNYERFLKWWIKHPADDEFCLALSHQVSKLLW